MNLKVHDVGAVHCRTSHLLLLSISTKFNLSRIVVPQSALSSSNQKSLDYRPTKKSISRLRCLGYPMVTCCYDSGSPVRCSAAQHLDGSSWKWRSVQADRNDRNVRLRGSRFRFLGSVPSPSSVEWLVYCSSRLFHAYDCAQRTANRHPDPTTDTEWERWLTYIQTHLQITQATFQRSPMGELHKCSDNTS